MILVGDVGGTKTALALIEETSPSGSLAPVREMTLPSREFPSLEAALERLMETGPPASVAAACFGVAGPVVDGRSSTTNLPWELDERQLARAIPSPRVKLLNDLEAAGYGVLGLSADQMVSLQAGRARRGHLALIAAGTGLGEALLPWDGARHSVIASEGGHADFAPRTELEAELFRFLMKEFGHVSYERVLSGPGLVNIYRFLRERGREPEPAWLTERLEREDPGAVVSELGLAGTEAVCAAALDVFASVYGAEAGNLALKGLAVGGVFVAGGIAPKIRSKLAEGSFVAAFRDKGRFRKLMATIPVHLVLEPRVPLLGAAQVARELLHRP
jgi:glucokinase